MTTIKSTEVLEREVREKVQESLVEDIVITGQQIQHQTNELVRKQHKVNEALEQIKGLVGTSDDITETTITDAVSLRNGVRDLHRNYNY